MCIEDGCSDDLVMSLVSWSPFWELQFYGQQLARLVILDPEMDESLHSFQVNKFG